MAFHLYVYIYFCFKVIIIIIIIIIIERYWIYYFIIYKVMKYRELLMKLNAYFEKVIFSLVKI